jgi:tetratricopeptide (TPR) repeat protein
MSEQTGNTQPVQPIKEDDTQPIKPVKPAKKGPRWGSIIISILGVVILLFLAGLGGYGSGIKVRTDTASQAISSQLAQQYQYALVDEQFGRYDAAKQRLEFIIQNSPSFPGVQDELAKVLVQMTIPTITPTPPPTSTPDMRGEQSLFATAQQLIAGGDWANALTELDQLRKQDPNYNTSQVDGMYYYTLRNYGVNLIQQQGNLEGGIYELTLAERFGPLDRDSNGLRDGARAYIQAASFFGIDWHLSVSYWAQVASGWPSLWDGTMTSAQRYQISLMRYGDDLVKQGQFCDAYQQYKTAQSIGNLDAAAAKGANQAFQQCYPATGVPTETPTGIVVPTGAPTGVSTEVPTEAPTEVPTETPTP